MNELGLVKRSERVGLALILSTGVILMKGKSPEAAADIALDYMKTRVGGLGGIIVISCSGDWAARFSTKQMAWATVKDDRLQCGVHAGERDEQSAEEALSTMGSCV
ncbi:UNVERIFIED_CONTAM: hypothetical protein K2H54_007995 [Gekko kuhli]